MSESIHVKYRPSDFVDVIGQKETVASLSRLVSDVKSMPHSFLFTGPSGVGKTTIARILAAKTGCGEQNLLEIDAATNSGVEAMRGVLDMVRCFGLGDSPTRFVIVDECHALSKQTWQSLLKSLEEPPDHVYWALCTTEPDKVPQTIRTRCHAFALGLVSSDDICELLLAVREVEKLSVADELVELASRKAEGSVRQALVYLSQLDGTSSKEAALKLMEKVDEESGAAVELARLLSKKQGLTWDRARELVTKIEQPAAESARITVVNYIAKVVAPEKGKPPGPEESARLLNVLSAFSLPFRQSEGRAQLLLAVGSLVFGEGTEER